jgi:hypothetical protein
VAYQLCEEMNGQVMTAFFASLKDIGIEPEVLVTDDSSLYPKSLAAVWAKCRHQLCRFHWVKAINSEVMRGIRDYRESLPKPEKRSGPGRPSNKEIMKQQRAAAARSTRDEVRKGRFLLLTRPENRDEKRRERLAALLAEHPTLATIRAFMVEFYGLFDGKPRPKEAKRRWAALVANPAYTACSYLAGALKPLSDEKKFGMRFPRRRGRVLRRLSLLNAPSGRRRGARRRCESRGPAPAGPRRARRGGLGASVPLAYSMVKLEP